MIRGNKRLIGIVLAIAILLLIPLVAMLFTDEVDWGVGDFIVAGVLLVGAGLTYELIAGTTGNTAYRTAVGVAVAAALILVWMNLAVGIIGFEDNLANLMYIGVLAVGIIGATIARLQSHGMAHTLFAMAFAQALVAMIALIVGLGSTGPIWPWDILILTGLFVVLWVVSALLFRRASATGSKQNRQLE